MENNWITIIGLAFCLNLSAQNIHRTACNGNLVRLDSMLTKTTIDIKDDRGRSLLHWAVACKQKKVFDFLIEKGITINGIDNQERTPMHVAVQFDNSEYLENLVELQENNDWKSLFGVSLVELAVLKKIKLF